ncbi:hypothetical protein GBP346_B0160 [Burkholderia pseudomallei MSHR346]|nr:hypothetical protein GBP346_B0160 [Burkholderia pseudomallei MSHR346]
MDDASFGHQYFALLHCFRLILFRYPDKQTSKIIWKYGNGRRFVHLSCVVSGCWPCSRR